MPQTQVEPVYLMAYWSLDIIWTSFRVRICNCVNVFLAFSSAIMTSGTRDFIPV
jgi:hypothetical protein